MVRVPKAAGPTDDLGTLLKTPGATTLLRAYVAIEHPRQRAALVNLAWALAEQAQGQEGRTETDRNHP